VLDASDYKHIVIMGDEKRAALEQAQTLTSTAAPVCAILNDTKVHWAP
jgi:6-phosphogluconolactonase